VSSPSALDSIPGSGAFREAGKLFQLTIDIVRAAFQRPFQLREFLQQAWFIASVTILPTALVAIPFGAVIALQLGWRRSPAPRGTGPAGPATPSLVTALRRCGIGRWPTLGRPRST